jgi:catechol 2,3-dioxygenase-like lactoylglutathione lyase family enzyme
MNQYIGTVALLVVDYDEAISFYTTKLNFRVSEDTHLSDTKRWVVVSPPGNGQCSLLLARAADEVQRCRIGYRNRWPGVPVYRH